MNYKAVCLGDLLDGYDDDMLLGYHKFWRVYLDIKKLPRSCVWSELLRTRDVVEATYDRLKQIENECDSYYSNIKREKLLAERDTLIEERKYICERFKQLQVEYSRRRKKRYRW